MYRSVKHGTHNPTDEPRPVVLERTFDVVADEEQPFIVESDVAAGTNGVGEP
jgi:hypothetical protein